MRNIAPHITKPYAFIALAAAGVACFSVIDVVYFETLGYSLAFIGVMVAAFNFAVSAAELPFAIVFDRYSNKLALQIGNALRIGAFLLFFFGVSEGSLILAQVAAGIAVAAMSGTANALVVNEIQQLTPAKATAAFGRITYLSAAAALVGGVVGMVLFSVAPRTIWLGATFFFILAAVVIATFQDSKAEIDRVPWKQYGREVLATIRVPFTWMMIITNAAAVAPFLLWQIKFDQVSLWFILAGFFGMQVANIVGPLVMHLFKVQVHHIAVVALLNVIVAFAFGFAEGAILVWVTFVLHVLLHCVLQILVSGLYHASIPNSVRASASSIVSMADSLIVAVVAPVVAIIGQQVGLVWAIGLSAGLYVLVMLGGLRSAVRRASVEV